MQTQTFVKFTLNTDSNRKFVKTYIRIKIVKCFFVGTSFGHTLIKRKYTRCDMNPVTQGSWQNGYSSFSFEYVHYTY